MMQQQLEQQEVPDICEKFVLRNVWQYIWRGEVCFVLFLHVIIDMSLHHSKLRGIFQCVFRFNSCRMQM